MLRPESKYCTGAISGDGVRAKRILCRAWRLLGFTRLLFLCPSSWQKEHIAAPTMQEPLGAKAHGLHRPAACTSGPLRGAARTSRGAEAGPMAAAMGPASAPLL